MPTPYHAQLGGIEGSGIYGKPNQAPDWAAIAQAISGGASSLLQGAYLRKMGAARLALEQRRLDQEAELHKATLGATEAYRQAQLGLQHERLQAPDQRVVKTQQRAFGDLSKEFPDHTLVKPDDQGMPAAFDPQGTDYVSALKDARTIKDKADQETQRAKDRLDSITKAAQLREVLNKQKGQAGGAAGAAQQRLNKNDLLNRIGQLSGGDPEKAAAIISSDKELAAAASKMGIQDYEVRASALAAADKKAGSSSTSTQTIDKSGTQTTRTVREKTPPASAAPAPAPPSAPDLFRTPGAPITPLTVPVNPNAGGLPSADSPMARAAQPITPLQVPGASPAAPVAAAPTAIPKLNMGSAAAAPPAGPAGHPAIGPDGQIKPIDETSLTDAALWEVKRIHGMNPDQATAYVKNRQKAPIAPVPVPQAPPPVQPPVPDEEPAPSGV